MTLASADNLAACRDCGNTVSLNARACPACGAPMPANAAWNGWGYEYKSKATFLNMPLVHIAFGRDKAGKLRVARGFVAIGQFARGVIVIAQFGAGLITVAQFGIGMLGVGQVILAGAAFGQIPIALVAVGQVPIALLWARGQVPIFPH